MRDVRRGIAQQAARHPQVDQERAARLEPDDQVLAAPVDLLDALARRAPRPPRAGPPAASAGRRRSRRARSVRPSSAGASRAPHGLDLGQLRQRLRAGRRAICAGRLVAELVRGQDAARPRRPASPRRARAPRPGRRPASTRAPRFAWQTTPTAWSISSLLRRGGRHRDGAPRLPTAIAPSRVTVPARGAATAQHDRRPRQRAPDPGRRPGRGSSARRASSAEPSATAASARRRPSSTSTPRSESASSRAHASSTSSVKSGGPSPRTVSRASSDLERVPDRGAERLVHVGQQAHDLAVRVAAELEHRLARARARPRASS